MASVIKRFITLKNLDNIIETELRSCGHIKNLTKDKITKISEKVFKEHYNNSCISFIFSGSKKEMIYSSILKHKHNINVLATARAIKLMKENPDLLDKFGSAELLYSFGTGTLDKINSKIESMKHKIAKSKYETDEEINSDLDAINVDIESISFLIGKDKAEKLSSELKEINSHPGYNYKCFVYSPLTSEKKKIIGKKSTTAFKSISNVIQQTFLDTLTIDDYVKVAKNAEKITGLLKQKGIISETEDEKYAINKKNVLKHADLTYLQQHKEDYVRAVNGKQDTRILDEIFIDDLEQRFSKNATPFLKEETEDPLTIKPIYHGNFIYETLKSLTMHNKDQINFQSVKEYLNNKDSAIISERFGRNPDKNPFTHAELKILKKFFEIFTTDNLIEDILVYFKVKGKSSNPLIKLIGGRFINEKQKEIVETKNQVESPDIFTNYPPPDSTAFVPFEKEIVETKNQVEPPDIFANYSPPDSTAFVPFEIADDIPIASDFLKPDDSDMPDPPVVVSGGAADSDMPELK